MWRQRQSPYDGYVMIRGRADGRPGRPEQILMPGPAGIIQKKCPARPELRAGRPGRASGRPGP